MTEVIDDRAQNEKVTNFQHRILARTADASSRCIVTWYCAGNPSGILNLDGWNGRSAFQRGALTGFAATHPEPSTSIIVVETRPLETTVRRPRYSRIGGDFAHTHAKGLFIVTSGARGDERG